MATIMIAEDNADTRRPLAHLLKMAGYRVVTASNAVEAMAVAKHEDPDLLLLDVSMPPIDGLTLLSRLRETREGAAMPVILVTGLSDELTHRRAEALGVKEYMVKAQFAPEELLAKIREHLKVDSSATA